ncbi:MAG: thiamine-phosphate kinase [Rhizobiales bacterium]|nr:thiamine-phosphate kinase [Hyphomicrobiales bacterium]
MADGDPRSAEDRLIATYFRPIATHPAALGLADDAAMLAPPAGHDLVLTADAVISGVHFFPEDAADMVAKKALRVNLSDLAAKGARPIGFLLTLALPKSVPEAWLEQFARGLASDAELYACPLMGGDSVRTSGPVAISITAIGAVPTNTMVRRSGAQAGDVVMVTGTIGDAALGLELRDVVTAAKRWKLDNKYNNHLIRRYLLPQPRNALAEAIRVNASAAMDVSDGLVGDLGKLCDASGCSAEIEVARVPLSEAAASVVASEPAAIEKVLTGGDDYEIVCAVPPDRLSAFRAAADSARVPVAEIGRLTGVRTPPRFFARDGKAMLFKKTSFSHF